MGGTLDRQETNRVIWIYGLQDPETKALRYVGKSVNPKARYANHIHGKEGDKSHKASWITSLKKKGLKPILVLLEPCTEETWPEREKRWIGSMRQTTFDLTNHCDGGRASPGFQGRHHTEEAKLKQSSFWKGRMRGPLTEEHKTKVSKARTGEKRPPFTEEHKRKIGEGIRAAAVRRQTEETDTTKFKLNIEKVRLIRESKESDRVLALRYGVGHTAIFNVRNRISWKHVP